MIIETDDDFDARKIAESGQCFRWERLGMNEFRILSGDRCLYMTSLGPGRFDLDCTEEDVPFWRDYFDLQESYQTIRGIPDPTDDPFLSRAATSERGIRILRQDPWETMVSFIISQNRNIPAICRSVELLCRAAGKELCDGRGETYHSFPAPSQILALSDEKLDTCRLGYRARYVRAAAQAVEEGTLDLNALRSSGEEDAQAALMSVCGIGVKVAACIRLFGLHQLNAFPVDTWMRRILENEYPAGYPYERYRPYNGVYQQYMFAYYRRLYA